MILIPRDLVQQKFNQLTFLQLELVTDMLVIQIMQQEYAHVHSFCISGFNAYQT